MSLRRPSLATVIASLALFVALGGVSVAQDAASSAVKKISGSSIKDRSVKAKQIARNTITGAEIKNGSINAGDLDAPLTAKLATVGAPGPAGPAGPAGAAGAPGPTVVPADGVDASKVKDFSLGARDVASVATTIQDLDFGTVNPSTCKSISSTSISGQPGSPALDFTNDAIVVTPPALLPVNALAVYAQPGQISNTIRVTICNVTGTPVVVGSRSFRVVAFDISG